MLLQRLVAYWDKLAGGIPDQGEVSFELLVSGILQLRLVGYPRWELLKRLVGGVYLRVGWRCLRRLPRCTLTCGYELLELCKPLLTRGNPSNHRLRLRVDWRILEEELRVKNERT
jgi:hypothetical protein